MRYNLPTTQSKTFISFGVPRNKCVGANHADKTPDKIVPGPGKYIGNVI